MKMGIKEFRERIGEVALGDEPVILTHHGRRVGQYIPDTIRPPTVTDFEGMASGPPGIRSSLACRNAGLARKAARDWNARGRNLCLGR